MILSVLKSAVRFSTGGTFIVKISNITVGGLKVRRGKSNQSKITLGHVLIAEDNKVNQEVVFSMLKILGYTSSVAQNGIEVLEYLKKERFDMVLMDCQMPEMGGYEATLRIRRGEAGESNKNIPIMAVTADAIQGSAQRCLDVGMNDFTSKPIQFEDFSYRVNRWISRGRGVIEKKAIENLRALAMSGNKSLVKDLINLFKQETLLDFQKMRSHIEKEDFVATAEIAHHLKSSCANLGAYKMQELAEEIEKSKNSGTKPQMAALVDSLVKEYHIAADELQKYMTSQS